MIKLHKQFISGSHIVKDEEEDQRRYGQTVLKIKKTIEIHMFTASQGNCYVVMVIMLKFHI